MKNNSLIRNFTLYSLIAFLITGIMQIAFLYNHMKNSELSKIKENAAIILHYAVQTEFTPKDFENNFNYSQIEKLDSIFKILNKEHNIIGIKIWSKSGELMYSYGNSASNQSSNDNKRVMDALSDETSYAISKNDNIEGFNDSTDETIEVFTPIVYNNKVAGAYEITKPFDEVKAHVAEVSIMVSLIIFLGLLILYCLLIKIIHNASNTLISQNKSLIEKNDELELSYIKLSSTYKNTISALSKAVDARDPYTAGHSERVTNISMKIGNIMKLSSEQLEVLEVAALFHDIGKIGIPDNILNKPGKLTEDEFDKIKKHPQKGVNILGNIDFLHSTIPVILHHHERYIGNGYPEGIKGEDIPIESRIIAVADTYDAMTTDRPYRKALSHKDAVDEIIRQRDLQFDKSVVQAFLKIFE